MNKKKLKKIYKDYQKYYATTMGWKMKETFKEWLQRLKDINSPLILP